MCGYMSQNQWRLFELSMVLNINQFFVIRTLGLLSLSSYDWYGAILLTMAAPSFPPISVSGILLSPWL